MKKEDEKSFLPMIDPQSYHVWGLMLNNANKYAGENMREDILEELLSGANQGSWRHSESRKYSHESVCAAQHALGIIEDGVIGDFTLYTIMMFQRDFEAKSVDGLLGPETFLLLYNAYQSGKIPFSTQKISMIMDNIEQDNQRAKDAYKDRNAIIDAVLYHKKKNFTKDKIRSIQLIIGADVDGIIGFDSIRKIRKWQKDHGLEPDGKIGNKTLKSMNLE